MSQINSPMWHLKTGVQLNEGSDRLKIHWRENEERRQLNN